MKNKEIEMNDIIRQIAYKISPSIGKLYDNHVRFFNDGIVELVCLIIANLVVFFLSVAGFIGWGLVLLNVCFATPLTFLIKYCGHKYWVWKNDKS